MAQIAEVTCLPVALRLCSALGDTSHAFCDVTPAVNNYFFRYYSINSFIVIANGDVGLLSLYLESRGREVTARFTNLFL